ncbi:MAG: adenosine deaminase, partial [Phycisphaerales bacterium]|nr:adenosine deaminase [Phycisphaerales bacterium]
MNAELTNIPKAQMHLHIEGAMRRGTYVELRRRREPGYCLEQSPWHLESYRFESLNHFLNTGSPKVIFTADDYRRIAFELFQDLRAQNVIYTELSIASHGLPIGEVAHAIHDAWRAAVSNDELTFGTLVGLFRFDEPEEAARMVREGIEARKFGVVGVDLLAHETSGDSKKFQNTYAMAREAGLGLRAHAGEGAGPENVWDAVRDLGVTRIGHGTRAIEDPELVRYLAANGIVLDMCPISNYRLRVVEKFEEHPIRRLFDAGVKITVSTDDPLFFNNRLTDEFAML